MLKTALIFTTVAALAASVASHAQPAAAPKATAVIVAPVVKRQFADQLEALATTRANESVVITADRAEKIATVNFDDGQLVKEGDLLVVLDKKQEQAELRAAEALTAERQDAYERAKGLSGSSALPKATLQTRLAALKQSEAETQAIKARLESYEIRAPFDGVLGLREVSVGTLVQPGDTITTIDDLSRIKVDFDVPSLFLTALQPGLAIKGFVEAFGDEQFNGVVQTVNTQVDPVTRTITVRAVVPNDDHRLKPGLLMNITLYKNPRESLLIPEQALIKRSDNNFVFTVEPQDGGYIAKQMAVTIGSRQPGVVEILSGLEEGQHIVSHGVSKIRDGAAVRIMTIEDSDQTLPALLQQAKRGETP